MLVTRQIPALWNGVSQQPDPVRMSSQAEVQINFDSSVVDGVTKRAPFEHVARLPIDSARPGSYMHIIDRDTSEQYVVVVAAGRIRVFDLAGVEKTVTAPLGWGYLALQAGVSPRAGYSATTVADYTFILNKTKTIGLLPVGADHDPPTGTYWWLNRQPQSSALRMFDPNEGGDGGGGGTTGGSGGDPPPPPVSNPTPDPNPDSNPVGTFKGAKQTLQDLPTTGNVNGDVWQIIGNSESDFASYYVIYSAGGWYECVKPGLKNMFDPLTMPWALIRNGNGTFTFGPFAWVPRHVGDDASNPHPSFVNRQIRDIFFHKNRLGFLVDENIVMSRAGAFGTFHRLTVVDYLADEVIDVAASETNVAKMEFAVPYQQQMMLFSDQTQFALTHKDILSGGSVSLDVTTRYPMVPGVRPAPSGSDVYFASHSSGWGKLREYFVNQDSITNDATDVSAHAPQYIPFGIHSIAASSEFDTVFTLTEGDKKSAYVYRYYWQTESEKAQSAWYKWEHGDPNAQIIAAKAIGGYLYCLVSRVFQVVSPVFRTYETSLERVALFQGKVTGKPYNLFLDRRYIQTAPAGVSIVEAPTYTIQLPYTVQAADRANFICVDGNGEEIPILSWPTLSSFTIAKAPYYIACGYKYESRYTFSQQYPINSRGEAVHTGRLQIKTFSVYYTGTAYFRAEVRPYGVASTTVYTREFPSNIGAVLNQGSIGSPLLADGKATFAVQANAREVSVSLVNDSHLGCTFHSAEWEGFYNNRARA